MESATPELLPFNCCSQCGPCLLTLIPRGCSMSGAEIRANPAGERSQQQALGEGMAENSRCHRFQKPNYPWQMAAQRKG